MSPILSRAAPRVPPASNCTLFPVCALHIMPSSEDPVFPLLPRFRNGARVLELHNFFLTALSLARKDNSTREQRVAYLKARPLRVQTQGRPDTATARLILGNPCLCFLHGATCRHTI